jgi:hypothetical protein
MEVDIHGFVNELHSWHLRTNALKAVESLRKNHFDAGFFQSGEEVCEIVLNHIKPGMSVAFGGSQTIKQLGLDKMISDAGAMILDHNIQGISPEQKLDIMRKQLVCDLFICSTNAISVQGELFNIDGNGNRLSAMIFGPKKVIIIAGTNKICLDDAAAWERVRNVAAPINMKRLNRPTPCSEKGICVECNVPSRGCNAFLVLKKKPSLSEISVFIVNESLGF